MAKLPHLPLERLDRTLDRRRVPAPVAPPARGSASGHAASITTQIDAAAAEQLALPKIEGIDPELILKVQLSAPIQEDTWRNAGFKVLAQEPGGILVLFSDDTELKAFRQRLDEYQKGVQGEAKNPAYNQLFAAIDDVRSLSVTDRIGLRLRAEGKSSATDFETRTNFTIDIELWDAPTQLDREVRVQKIVEHVENAGGEILSRYIGSAGLIVLRARGLDRLRLDRITGLPQRKRADRPGSRQKCQHVLEMVGCTLRIDPIDIEVARVVAAGNTEIDSTVRQDVQCCDFLGETNRVMQGRQQYGKAHAQSSGARQNGRRQNQRRMASPPLDLHDAALEVLLVEPDPGEA